MDPTPVTPALLDTSFGPDSVDRREALGDASSAGADAALESFYRALNHRDLDLLTAVWHDHELVQVDNPVGGILRSRTAVADLYGRIFGSGLDLEVTFGDAVVYRGSGCVVYAGRESGSYRGADAERVPLEIRTTRVVAWSAQTSSWGQVHHHGSLDDAAALAAYQRLVRGQ